MAALDYWDPNVSNSWITSTNCTSNWSGSYTLSLQGAGADPTPPPPKVKTELDLLDERVDNLRVRL